MQKDVLELTDLSDSIYSKRIWETPSTYQVGYELVTSVEKVNEMVIRAQGSPIYFLKYSHISINGEEHPLESIEANYVGRCNKKMIKMLFKCEYKEVIFSDRL